MIGHIIRSGLERPPEIANESVGIINGFGPPHLWRPARTVQEDGAGPEERLDVIIYGPESAPNLTCYGGLTAEIREW
jgi:hypothetical protein